MNTAEETARPVHAGLALNLTSDLPQAAILPPSSSQMNFCSSKRPVTQAPHFGNLQLLGWRSLLGLRGEREAEIKLFSQLKNCGRSTTGREDSTDLTAASKVNGFKCHTGARDVKCHIGASHINSLKLGLFVYVMKILAPAMKKTEESKTAPRFLA